MFLKLETPKNKITKNFKSEGFPYFKSKIYPWLLQRFAENNRPFSKRFLRSYSYKLIIETVVKGAWFVMVNPLTKKKDFADYLERQIKLDSKKHFKYHINV